VHAVSIQNNLTVDTDHGPFYPIADLAGNALSQAGAAVSGRARWVAERQYRVMACPLMPEPAALNPAFSLITGGTA